MKIEVMRQIVGILCSSNKSYYSLEGEANGKRFRLSINDPCKSSAICMTVSDMNSEQSAKSSVEVNSEYDSVEEVPLSEMRVTMLTEYKRTINGIKIKEDTDFLYRENELFLKIFKILKENAVFVIQNDVERRVAYYINSKVFYTEVKDEYYELVETDIFRLYASMPRSNIVLISQVPKRLNKSQFIIEHNRIAETLGKKFRNTKNGVGVV